MVVECRLRCLPLLMLVYCVVALPSVEGSSGTGATSRGGQDRRNAANKHRRSTTPDPPEQSTPPSGYEGQRDRMPGDAWAPEIHERPRHGNSVKVTRKATHSGRTKARKNGTHVGSHVAVTKETGFSTTGTLPMVTDHVVPWDVVTTYSPAGVEGSRRGRPSGGRHFAGTRTTPETIEARQRITEAYITQRIHRVKTATTLTTYPETTATTTMTTATTIATTPSTTATKLPARKHSATPMSGRTPSMTRYSNRTTPHPPGSGKGEGCSSSCEMTRCETVEAEMCQGRVVKDRCNCCPVCFAEARSTDESKEDPTTRKTSQQPNNACDGMQCPKHKVCILNIQGIPMCRCPNIYSCKGIDRNPLCAQNGVTYKNKCFLKVDECTLGRRIRVERRGSCQRSKSTPAQLDTSLMMWKTSRLESDHKSQEAAYHRKTSKNDPWRHAATNNDKTKLNKLRKRAGNKSQFS